MLSMLYQCYKLTQPKVQNANLQEGLPGKHVIFHQDN